MTLIQIDALTRRYGRGHAASNALRGLSLSVVRGEFIAIQGESGSGKTTLLNLAAGFDRPDSGRITILDRDITTMGERESTLFRRRHLGVVFQALNLLPTLTASENICLQSVLNGENFGMARKEAEQLLTSAGLAGRGDSFPEELSGGEQQRIAVLRALIHRPEILLLDEPTSCLDTENTRILMELLTQINCERGTTILIATHDPRVAACTTRTVTVCDGVIL